MAGTKTDASTPITPGFITTTSAATWTLPLFTPESGCLDTTNLFFVEGRCSWGTGIGKNKPADQTCTFFDLDEDGDEDKLCMPGGGHVATQCPYSYQAVHTEDEKDGTLTSRTVICCPTVHDFGWGEATMKDQRGSSASLGFTSCLAAKPSFPGNPPWTMNILYESETDRYTKVTFDPKTDILVASAISIDYVINGSSTCVPDCDRPYTGGEWPMPPPPSTDGPAPPPVNDSNLQGYAEFVFGIIGAVLGVFVLCVGGCTWICVRRRRKRRRALAQEQEQASRTAQEDQGAIQMGKM